MAGECNGPWGRVLQRTEAPGNGAMMVGLLGRQLLLIGGVWVLWQTCGAHVPSLGLGILARMDSMRARFVRR